MIINHNVTALNTHNKLSAASAAQSKSMEKLASGLRINKAGDDAAGLAISEKMRGQVRGLDQASRNAQDGISMIQTAEGALNETHDILQRMRELSVQASNDTNTDADRGEMQKEMNQLTSEINRIGNTTEFNTKKLLNGKVNVTEAVSANVKGTAVGNTINIVATATRGSATGVALSGTKTFHDDLGASVEGNIDLETAIAGGSGIDLSSGDSNELTLTVNGVQNTIALDKVDYDNSLGKTSAELIADINSKLSSASIDATAELDSASGKLKITSNDTSVASDVKIDGGGAANVLFGTSWATSDTTETARSAANNKLSVSVNGVNKEITLANVSYDTTDPTDKSSLLADLNSKLDTAFGAGNAVATFDASNKLVITSSATGSNSNVSEISGTAAADLGLASATSTAGQDANNVVSMLVDGETVTATLAAGSYDSNVLASTLQSEINADTTVDAKVSFEDGKFNVTSGKAGATGSVSVTDNAFSKSIGLSAGSTSTAGVDAKNDALKFQIGANAGQSMSVDISDMRSSALEISSTTGTGKSVVDGQGNTLTASYTSTSDVTNGTNNSGTEKALDISSADKATAAVAVLDESIAKVSAERSKLGATQNRLEHTINNLKTSSENLTAAESRVRDVDMAKEMMNQTKNSILAQAAQAMLAQANQQPQGVLQLLR